MQLRIGFKTLISYELWPKLLQGGLYRGMYRGVLYKVLSELNGIGLQCE